MESVHPRKLCKEFSLMMMVGNEKVGESVDCHGEAVNEKFCVDRNVKHVICASIYIYLR